MPHSPGEVIFGKFQVPRTCISLLRVLSYIPTFRTLFCLSLICIKYKNRKFFIFKGNFKLDAKAILASMFLDLYKQTCSKLS